MTMHQSISFNRKKNSQGGADIMDEAPTATLTLESYIENLTIAQCVVAIENNNMSHLAGAASVAIAFLDDIVIKEAKSPVTIIEEVAAALILAGEMRAEALESFNPFRDARKDGRVTPVSSTRRISPYVSVPIAYFVDRNTERCAVIYPRADTDLLETIERSTTKMLKPSSVDKITRQIVRGVAEIHRSQLIAWMDCKAENVLCNPKNVMVHDICCSTGTPSYIVFISREHEDALNQVRAEARKGKLLPVIAARHRGAKWFRRQDMIAIAIVAAQCYFPLTSCSAIVAGEDQPDTNGLFADVTHDDIPKNRQATLFTVLALTAIAWTMMTPRQKEAWRAIIGYTVEATGSASPVLRELVAAVTHDDPRPTELPASVSAAQRQSDEQMDTLKRALERCDIIRSDAARRWTEEQRKLYCSLLAGCTETRDILVAGHLTLP